MYFHQFILLQTDVCYCLETEPSEIEQKGDTECTVPCLGDSVDVCGGQVNHGLITGSEIGEYIKNCTFKKVSKCIVNVEDAFM